MIMQPFSSGKEKSQNAERLVESKIERAIVMRQNAMCGPVGLRIPTLISEIGIDAQKRL